MATGSPTSTLSKNLMPLVVRPSRTSRQGMILLLSMGAVPGQEVLEELQPEPATLFRVELGGHQCAPAHGAGEIPAMAGDSYDHGGLSRFRIITVDKIVFGRGREILKNLVLLNEAHPVPTHVGYL